MFGLNIAQIVAVVVGIAALSGGIAYAWHEHNDSVAQAARSAMDLAAQKAINQQQAEDAARVNTALRTEVAVANARAAAAADIRKQINAAPRTTGCATSPAIHAVLTGLQHGAGSPGPVAAPATAGHTVDVPPPAHAR
jgi:hypothetical protein